MKDNLKTGLTYASHVWGIYAVLMVLSLIFLAGTSVTWIMIVLNALVLIVFGLLVFNDGAYNGEKACTLQATLDKQQQEGHTISDKQRAFVFSRKTAVAMLVICALPFLIISVVNLAVAPNYPVAEVEEAPREAFTYDYDAVEAAANTPVNYVNIIARTVFMPYVATYSLVSNDTLNRLFLLYSLIFPLCGFAGYMTGPIMRRKKLHDIALGKKRKMRNLKVNRTRKPRGPKAEV